jgi:hypothetical protein
MDARALADDLATVPEASIVRVVADWTQRAIKASQLDLVTEPDLDGRDYIDAIVAAAVVEVARRRAEPAPSWTRKEARRTSVFWYPGPATLFPNALVNAPLAFRSRGVFIESASLRSI